VNLAISLAAAGSLAGRAEVLMTRRDDRTVSLRERIDLANNRGATLFLSVHCNGATQPEANGTETFHYAGAALGRTLATLVQRRLLAAIRRRDRGVKQANFFVLRETSCPAALAEILFITNPQEAALLTDPAFQRRVGEALGAGVIDYLEQVR
jgi:N-acetylmuramoyl-L-alanine amidase